MARAGLSARQQALAEQQQALTGATGLLGAGYSPQQQALDALRIGAIVPQLAQRGQLGSTQLQAQLEQSGLEANLGMMDLASRLRQQRDRGLMEALMGRQPTLQEQVLGKYVGLDPNQLGQQGAINPILGFIGDVLGFGKDDVSDETNAELDALIEEAKNMPSIDDILAFSSLAQENK
jgi:hypothetical protein